MHFTVDLLHQPFGLAGAAPDSHKLVVPSLATLRKPSGWLQLVELDTEPKLGSRPELNFS